jgi:hypothetical protein
MTVAFGAVGIQDTGNDLPNLVQSPSSAWRYWAAQSDEKFALKELAFGVMFCEDTMGRL